jgi:signal transduction histidine kinase
MNLSFKQIKTSIAIILVFILIGQGVWISNMYKAYRDQWTLSVNQSIEKAILREGASRYEQLGGTIVYSPLTTRLDTSRYITKTLRSQDTSIQITFDRYDPHSQSKLHQFLLKDDLPVNVKQLDSLFRRELMEYQFPLNETTVEYIDLETQNVLEKSDQNLKISSKWISTQLIPIDIFNTIAIRAYAKISSIPVLKQMAFQLFLSFLLISFCVFLLFTIIRTFFWKEKIELMRQESINAMTHEFKRPISSAVAQVALIPYYIKENPSRVVKYAENTLLELNKLTLYTERIQRISNDSNAGLSLNKTPVYLPDFFNRVHEKYSKTAEKQIDLQIHLKNTAESWIMDLLHMSNVVDNLIENAIKYSKDKLSIIIQVANTKEGLIIRVKDNGQGILKSEIPAVFDKYFRSSNVTGSAIGFGLGLTYCKLVVEEHGGTISVESELDKGSEFSVTLPLVEKEKLTKNDA